MKTGAIPVENLSGGLDLRATIESGQSYLWRRDDGRMYRSTTSDGSAWYHTVVDGEFVRVRQTGGTDGLDPTQSGLLEWQATTDADPLLRELLRLDDDLDAIFETVPDDPLIADAYDAFGGLRLVEDPSFPCLISFICSAQMRVSRIHRMQVELARAFGEPIDVGGETYHAFPTPERLAAATEDELRDLGLGYRAPYVQRTAAMVAGGDAHPDDARGLPYEEARETLTQFVGVGDKVADCVLLFALGYTQAIPLDTWIRGAIEEHYPECDRGSYAETARALRERFGGEYAGYAQTYVFHYLRTRG